MFKMLKLLCVILIALILVSVPVLAQNKITGRVIDVKGQPLSYATVVLLSPVDSTVQYYGVTDLEGKYQIKYIKTGKYLMQYSYVSMEVIYEEVTIPSESGEDFGKKTLKAAANIQEVIEISAEAIPIQFKRDTVSFNAKAFKTRTGAVVEELLQKIPGIEVDNAGNMKALGEDVTKVLVDGKEFFSGDPKVATKNLPADAIDKVEVFDKKSEEAEFMGVEDGIQDRTINLLLNEDSKKGFFGNIDGGGGEREHYKARGDIYRFSSSFQSAVLGMKNNINEFGFSGGGANTFGQEVSGLNTASGVGLNLMYNGAKYNRYYMSYTLSPRKTILEQNTSTENFLSNGSYYQDTDMDRNQKNVPHMLRFGVHHRFNTKHNLILKGAVTANSQDVYTKTLTDTRLNDTPVNNLDNTSNSKTSNNLFYINGNDIIKLNKNTTQLKTNLTASYTKNTSELDFTNNLVIHEKNITVFNENYLDNNTKNLSLNFFPTLVQKLNPFWYLTTGVNVGSKKKELDRELGTSSMVVDSLSANFHTNEMNIRPSLSIQRSTLKTHFTMALDASLINFDKELSSSSIGKTDYSFLLPRVTYRNMYREGRRFELGYTSSVAMPGLTQLLPVTNTLNQLSLYHGNAGLKPEYRHRANLTWSYFDAFSFTTFFTRITAQYTADKISTSQIVNDDLTKIITPVNVSNHRLVTTNSTFSTPIRRFGVNVLVKSNEYWSKGISLVNSEENQQTVLTHSIDLRFQNRGQGPLNVTVGGSVSRTSSKYSIAESMNNNYYNTTYYTDIYYNPNDYLTMGTEANVVSYNSDSFSGTETIPLWNANISYFFLEGGKLGLVLSGNDLLNKFTSFNQTNGINYIMEQDQNTIGRYVMLTLRLRFGSGIGRGFAKKMR